MRKIVCFGDTITEMGSVLELRGFAAQLADRYVRRADVLIRGFTGYTTNEAVKILKSAVLDEQPDFVIMFFGMNDSALPGQIQHVPVKQYRRNMREMAQKVAMAGAWLVVVTPPPVDEKRIKSREMEHTALYADAARQVASDMQVPVVDLFSKIQEEENWPKTCLLDGLHLSANGMNRLYEELAKTLDRMKPLEDFERISVNGI